MPLATFIPYFLTDVLFLILTAWFIIKTTRKRRDINRNDFADEESFKKRKTLLFYKNVYACAVFAVASTLLWLDAVTHSTTFIICFAVDLFFLVFVIRFFGKRRHESRILKPEDCVDKISFEKRKRLFLYERIFASSGWVVGSISLWFAAFKIEYYLLHFDPDHKAKTKFDSALYHFDTTGIIVGIVGIVVGLLIFVAAENNTEKKNNELSQHLDELSKATQSIETTNKDEKEQLDQLKKQLGELNTISAEIKSYLTHLNQHKSLSQRLDGIKDVIEHAQKFNNNLYVLTNAPAYGRLLLGNADILMKEQSNWPDMQAMSYKEFYWKYIQGFEEKIENNRNALLQLSKRDQIKLSFLRNPLITPLYQDKFRVFVEKRVVEPKRVLIIDPSCDDLITDEVLKDNSKITDRKNTFLYWGPVEKDAPMNEAKRRNMFIDWLVEKNTQAFALLKSKADITCLDYIPFQFYLSCPKENMANSRVSALVIFTNYYDIAQDYGVVSFSSESENLCTGLKKMYENLVKTQKEKDEHVNPMKKIFNPDKQGNVIRILVKNLNVTDPLQGLTTYTQVTPVADNMAKDQLLDFLESHEIGHAAKVKYMIRDDLRATIDWISGSKFTYFSIGLFYNPIAEFFGDLKREDYKTPMPAINHIYKLTDPGQPGQRKSIEVIRSGNIYNLVQYPPAFERYLERFSPDDLTHGPYDYTLIVKQKIDDQWVFIAGGINYLGSENIATCLEQHLTLIGNEVGGQEQFVAICKVYPDNEPTDLVFLSKIDTSGNVFVITFIPDEREKEN